MKNRILACLLSVLMLVAMVPVSVSAATTLVDSTDNLQTIIDSAAAGAVIQLNADFTGAFTVGSAKDITIDLNGKSISSDVSTITVDGGKLTVKDSVGTGKIITSDGTGSCEAVAVKNNGTFTLKSGTIQSAKYGIYAYSSGGSIVIEGGKVEVNATSQPVAIAIGNNKGSATITGGQIVVTNASNDGSWTAYAWDGGKIAISGGIFSQSFNSAYLAAGYTQVECDGGYTVQKHTSLETLFAGAQAGDTITITEAGIYSWPNTTLPDGVTVKATVDGVVVTNGPIVRGKDLTVDNIDFIRASGVAVIFKTSGNSAFKNSKIEAPYGTWDQWGDGKVDGELVIEKCEITGTYYALHIGGGTGVVTLKNSKLSGWNAFGGSLEKVNVDECAFSSNGTDNGWDAMFRVYGEAEITDSTFTPDMVVESLADDASVALQMDGCTVTDGSSIIDIINTGAIGDTELVLLLDVTFVNNGVSTVEKVNYQDTVTAPADPTLVGNTFLGWYNGDTKYDFTKAVESDLVLTAKWAIDDFKLICMDEDVVLSETTYAYGADVVAPETPVKSGYTFAGWVDAEGNAVELPATMPAGNVTIYASWTKNQPTFDYVLFALTARYAQRYDVLVSAENATVTGDMSIKYKRNGTVNIDVADGYQIVDVIVNGQSLGAVEKVTFKKVMAPQTLVVVTEPIPVEEPAA